MKKHIEKLNEAQKKAIAHTDGPLLIIAGAGAGKTKTLTHRIVNLISQGVPPEKILAVTFTNKAAKEMRDRVHFLMGRGHLSHNIPYVADDAFFERTKIPFISTFHALGVYIIRENTRFFGLTKHFSILDKDDSLALIKEAMKAAGFDPRELEPKKILGIVSRAKSRGFSCNEFGGEKTGFLENIALLVWEKYEKFLAERNSLDFDDLLLKTVELIQKNTDIRARYRDRFTHIHVDEYQDTNEIQYELTRLLAGARKNICVVGDIDQSIYSWRGADYTNILDFEEDYPDATVIVLEENYRSTKTIIAAAEKVIKKNKNRKEKNLFTNNKTGEKISLFVARDEKDEAEYVAISIQDLIKNGVVPSDIAVLYRANFQSRILEEAFLGEGIPYQVLGTRFFERKEVKDMLAYLKAAQNESDWGSIERIINVPARGIGKVTRAKIAAGKKGELPPAVRAKVESFYKLLADIRMRIASLRPSGLLKFILVARGLEKELSSSSEDDLERLENIRELVSLSSKYDALRVPEATEKFLLDAALMTDEERTREGAEGVKLMTVHAAKGLEFSHVFIVGLEDGLFPHAKPRDEEIDEEEERRLFYVALTRAKEKLYLSYANVRTLFGTETLGMPSEFIFDIDDSLLEPADKNPVITIT